MPNAWPKQIHTTRRCLHLRFQFLSSDFLWLLWGNLCHESCPISPSFYGKLSCSCSLSIGVCWGFSLRNLSTPVLGRLFKQAHVHAGIDFKKYDDIEVFFFESWKRIWRCIYFPLLCYCSLLEGIHHFFPFIISMFFWGCGLFFGLIKNEISFVKPGWNHQTSPAFLEEASSFDQPAWKSFIE